MASKPKVTILCLAYNQEEYIRQTLDGFLIQRTDFSFEIIINDDASTDGTADIIREYATKNPTIFKPIYQTINQFSSGSAAFINRMFEKARGEYIAFCEGDDYWTDPQKLQRQADFLDSHSDYALCFHPVRVVFDEGEEPDAIYPEDRVAAKFTIKELLKRNFIQTNSVMCRRQNYKELADDIMPRDWYWHLYHAQFGKIGFINKVMAVYRRHSGSVWWDGYKNIDRIWKIHGVAHVALFMRLLDMYGDNEEYQDIIYSHISNAVRSIDRADRDNEDSMLAKVIASNIDRLSIFLKSHVGELEERDKRIDKMTRDLYDLQTDVATLKNLSETQTEEIRLIKASRVWKMRNVIVQQLVRRKA